MPSAEPFYVLVWPGQQPSEHYLRQEDAQCSGPGCIMTGVIMDAEYEEPWCRKHAEQFTGEEAIGGPEIVRVGSPRYKEITERN